ncbi:hypothetical protein WJX73_004533 [Symbiochloris irregularis]|uniref:F-box domain-containing protein n=1 Tax=Symbiochloris irregularis TaxID=706552 RepID=A0AAW1PJ04_9CHLO
MTFVEATAHAELVVTGGQVNQGSLTDRALREPLTSYVLPRLDLCSLASLSCTCRAMREQAYLQDDWWSRSAAGFLPLQHPSVAGYSRTAIQDLMQRRSNIICDQADSRLVLDDREPVQGLFSPCSNLIAVVSYKHITVYNTHSGQQAWQRDLHLLKGDDGLVLKGFEGFQAFEQFSFEAFHFDSVCLTAFATSFDYHIEPEDHFVLVTLNAQTACRW